jgi:hypothetical protein
VVVPIKTIPKNSSSPWASVVATGETTAGNVDCHSVPTSKDNIMNSATDSDVISSQDFPPLCGSGKLGFCHSSGGEGQDASVSFPLTQSDDDDDEHEKNNDDEEEQDNENAIDSYVSLGGINSAANGDEESAASESLGEKICSNENMTLAIGGHDMGTSESPFLSEAASSSVANNDQTGTLIPLPQNAPQNLKSGASNIFRASGYGSVMASDLDDGVGWIDTKNLASHRSDRGCSLGIATAQTKKNSKKEKLRDPKVACVTADFTMQNVLMQMHLDIFSIDGLLIKHIKQWVLRCMACFQIHHQMDRLFCSKCGANHLSRVAVSIDSTTGELRLHLKANYRTELRVSYVHARNL